MASSKVPAQPASAIRTDELFGVRLSPLVYLNVMDQILRAPTTAPRVYGVLLGAIGMTSVDVSNSFAVMLTETDEELTLEPSLLHNMLELNEQANRSEDVVGWYAAGKESLGEWTGELQRQFHTQARKDNLIHIHFDTNFLKDQIKVHAYQYTNCRLPLSLADENQDQVRVEEEPELFLYTPIPCEVLAYDMDRTALSILTQSFSSTAPTTVLASKLDVVIQSTERLKNMVDKALKYVQEVNSGKHAGDPKIGQHLKETLAAAPKMDPSAALHDLLLVVYLSQLAKTQISLHERLQTYL